MESKIIIKQDNSSMRGIRENEFQIAFNMAIHYIPCSDKPQTLHKIYPKYIEKEEDLEQCVIKDVLIADTMIKIEKYFDKKYDNVVFMMTNESEHIISVMIDNKEIAKIKPNGYWYIDCIVNFFDVLCFVVRGVDETKAKAKIMIIPYNMEKCDG